jgi:hypothetical protein
MEGKKDCRVGWMLVAVLTANALTFAATARIMLDMLAGFCELQAVVLKSCDLREEIREVRAQSSIALGKASESP